MHERGRGYHTFPPNFFCHTVSKNVVGEHFGVSGIFGYRKILCVRQGGCITFLRRKLFVTQYRKISLGNTSVYQKNSGIEKFYARERGGITFLHRKLFVIQYRKISLGSTSVYQKISDIETFNASEREEVSHFSVENVLLNSTKKFRWRTLRCIGNIRVSENFMHQRGRGITFLRRKLFVTQSRKISLGNTSVYREILGIEKFRASEREGYHISPSKTFCHTVPKNFVVEHFGVSENFGFRNILCIRERERERERERDRERGEYHVSPSKFFCLTVPIKFVGERFGVSEKLGYRKILCMREGGGITFLRRKLFVTQYQKISLGNT